MPKVGLFGAATVLCAIIARVCGGLDTSHFRAQHDSFFSLYFLAAIVFGFAAVVLGIITITLIYEFFTKDPQ